MIDRDKRASLRGLAGLGLGAVGVGGVFRAAHAQDDQKVAQNVVQYQTTPKGDQECDKCVNWTPPNACKIVAGTIVPKGWCIAFAPKDG